MTIVEYVPDKQPIIIAKAKLFITCPPNKNNINTTVKVVKLVIIVLESVSFYYLGL